MKMYDAQANSPSTTIVGTINDTTTSITVTDASILPTLPNLLTLGWNKSSPETVLAISKVGNDLTVIRGFEGTATSWADGTAIARVFTAYDHNATIDNLKKAKSLSIAMGG